MYSKPRFLVLVSLVVTLLGATWANAYTVYLKDGSRLLAKEAPTIQGDQAIIVLHSGTRTSIAAGEIDLTRTKEANQTDLGSAMVLEDGKFTEKPVTSTDEGRQERLSDVAKRGNRGRAVSRAPISRSGVQPSSSVDSTDLYSAPRRPFRDLDVMEPIQSAFLSQGAGQVKIYLGTKPDRLLLEVTTNSEASVFRSLKVAAGALNHLRSNGAAGVEAFELVMQTGNRQKAGQFLIEPEHAQAISSGKLEISKYFVEHVRF